MSFYVVKFTEENENVDYISGDWLQGRSSCLWPKVSTSVLVKLRRGHEKPQPDWMPCPIKILKGPIGKFSSMLFKYHCMVVNGPLFIIK